MEVDRAPCVSMRVIGHGLPPFVGFFVTSEPFPAFGFSPLCPQPRTPSIGVASLCL